MDSRSHAKQSLLDNAPNQVVGCIIQKRPIPITSAHIMCQSVTFRKQPFIMMRCLCPKAVLDNNPLHMHFCTLLFSIVYLYYSNTPTILYNPQYIVVLHTSLVPQSTGALRSWPNMCYCWASDAILKISKYMVQWQFQIKKNERTFHHSLVILGAEDYEIVTYLNQMDCI